MQNKLLAVLKIEFLNQSGLNQFRYENNKKKRGQSITVLIGITLLGIILVGFSFLIGFGYGIMGMAEVIPGFALTMVSLVTLIFSFLKTSGYLFAFQDYDMLMSWPLSVKTYVFEQSFVQPSCYAANGECLFNLFVFPFFCREGSGLPDVDCGSGACAAFANDGCRIFWDDCHGDWF